LPRQADLAVVSPGELSRLAQAYNTTPRKCLAFHSPHEVFSSLINRVALQP
jgi:IS30 family transposase